MNIHELDALEKESIRSFVGFACANGYLDGSVLDLGCGKQPYREMILERCDLYTPFDRADFLGNVSGEDVGEDVKLGQQFDAIVATQVIQYVPAYVEWLENILLALVPDGVLVMTYPTHWPELRDELWRFTELGMTRLLRDAGFSSIVHHERRAAIEMDGFLLAVGYGVIARA